MNSPPSLEIQEVILNRGSSAGSPNGPRKGGGRTLIAFDFLYHFFKHLFNRFEATDIDVPFVLKGLCLKQTPTTSFRSTKKLIASLVL